MGINTPEIDHKNNQSQPFAEQARKKLIRLLGSDRRLKIKYGVEKKDRHGRLLAHIASMSDKNIQRELLLQGLAFWIVVPPNTYVLSCYQQAEQFARKRGLGIWGHPSYLPKSVVQTDIDQKGFKFVTGIVQRIGKSKKSIWLNLAETKLPSLERSKVKRHKVALRISRSDLHYFNETQSNEDENQQHIFDSWKGKRINVRGWSYVNKGQLVILVKHPAAIELLD